MTHSLDHLSRSRVDHELMEMAARREAETAPQTGSELECPVCGTVAINRDFCVCGEYLAWDPPGCPYGRARFRPAVVPAAGAAGAP
jgi:hypothetical protein